MPQEDSCASDSNAFEDEKSYSSVVKDMVYDDEQEQSKSDNEQPSGNDDPKPALLDLSPEKYFKYYECSGEEAQEQQQEDDDEEIDDAQFKTEHPSVALQKRQLDYNFDFARQLRDLDIYENKIWVSSDVSEERREVIERFLPNIMSDFTPMDILCYVCSEASRKPRFLMALAMGIPIIDAASFDDPMVIHKSKTLDYAYLHLKPLNPSVNDVARLFNESFKKILVETYENYSLAFI